MGSQENLQPSIVEATSSIRAFLREVSCKYRGEAGAASDSDRFYLS